MFSPVFESLPSAPGDRMGDMLNALPNRTPAAPAFGVGLAASMPQISVSDALVLLMTVEALLFAGLAVSVTLAGPSELGGPPAVRGAKLAWTIAIAIALISFGAAMAWLDLYVGHGQWPDGFRARAIAVAIAVGIVSPSVLGAWIAYGV
jgi:hypothetical protein